MLSNHKLQLTLDEIKEISRIETALYNEHGKLLVSTFIPGKEFDEAVLVFAESMAESQILLGYHFFKVVVEDEVKYILLAHSASEEAYMVGKLAVCQIRNLAEMYRDKMDRNHFMQNVLLGNMLVVDMYNKARKFHIEQAERVVFVIEVDGKKDSYMMELVKGMFGGSGRDFVMEVDEQNIIFIKDVCDLKEEEDLERLAKMMVDNLHSEAMVRVRVGYGNRAKDLQDIAKAYQEALMAIEVGKVFYAGKEVVSYSRLGIGRLIYQIPMSLCEMFIREVFGDEMPDVFSDENVLTIQSFFENNLNISETARQLFVHRNTLVYRLERLEKAIGLDIRKFEDAMLFKIAMMVLSHMAYQRGETQKI
ncbi:MAG: PucR family transcriptional regulator [Eubacterium sp.]|nr:PucR family transcriptional regulator [Eubacterium sp.]